MKIYGRNTVYEALRAKHRPLQLIYLLHGCQGNKIEEIRAIAEARGIPIRWEDRRRLDFIAGNPDHQGVLAIIDEGGVKKLSLAELVFKGQMGDRQGLFVLLDGVQDPRNLGAVVRTAAAVEADGVIIPGRRSAGFSAGAAKAAVGSEEYIEVVEVTNVVNALETFKAAGYWIYGAEAGGEKDYTLADYNRHLVLVLGGEEKGIRPLVKKNCDELLNIPISSQVESLNVSVAAALLLFEARRGRGEGRNY